MHPGSLIGHYLVEQKLGAGAMGAVYQATHSMIGRHVAIKTLLPELSEQREAIDRFFNEARATSSVADPGIVQVFDFGFDRDGTAYIVMELLEGESLEERIARLGRIPPGDALRIIGQAASSLTAAHDQGIIHRDLKPENIVMVRDAAAQGGERPKILDFGIAKLDRAVNGRVTQENTMLGTPLYMPPEQARGAVNVDARADVYSLGCVLFHMLTGRPPFDADSGVDIIVAHLRERPPAPSELVPEIPACVDELVLRCLAKDPDDRVASMSELRVECSAALGQLTHQKLALSATVSRPVVVPFPPAKRLRRSIVAAAGVLGVVALVTGAIELGLARDPGVSASALAAPPTTPPAEPEPDEDPPPPVSVPAPPPPIVKPITKPIANAKPVVKPVEKAKPVAKKKPKKPTKQPARRAAASRATDPYATR